MSKHKILVVSVEVAPYAKVGGLADVVAGLPKELRRQGHDARIFMPAYGMVLNDPSAGAKKIARFHVNVSPGHAYDATLYEASFDGVPVWLVSAPDVFEHIDRSEDLYSPGRDAYLFFSESCIAACEKMNWIPDVVHCNDWHTGFTPVMIREKAGLRWDHTATVFTIHNLAYQGEFGKETLAAAGLSDELFTMDRLETFGLVNFVKSACVYADQVNTVSPTYAKEIQTAEYGDGLWGVMQNLAQRGRLRGILNGIDTDFFNPEKDRFISENYSAADLAGKRACKKALQKELGLPVDESIPIASVVSRLSNQKGFDLMIKASYGMLDLPVQYVVLGVGDPWAASELRALEKEWPDRVKFVERFDAPLAQRIYGGSDIFLMPSSFEPCGLGQLIALRYGTIPVVRKTGGLADTVFEKKNGFVFEERSARQFFEAVKRSVIAFRDEKSWTELVSSAMSQEYGWPKSAKAYVKMYEEALAFRQAFTQVAQPA